VTNGNTATIRTVTVAQTAGNNVGLNAGLSPGDVVVIDGQDKLQEGSKINTRTATGDATGGATSGSADQAGAPKSGNANRKASAQPGGSKR
jgi:membrane fusion protein, multidrug efflux system